MEEVDEGRGTGPAAAAATKDRAIPTPGPTI